MANRSGNSATQAGLAALLLACGAARADEGMWLINRPPRAALQERYKFDATPQWLEHLQKSAVRFNVGGSGAFVSPEGLVLTNHHVGSDAIAKLSTPERDLLRAGFLASGRADELRCPDLELNVLWEIEDVTAAITQAADSKLPAAEAFIALRKRMTELEQQSEERSGLDSQVVTLYQGARYHLYRYKRYTDVRLVFAPEQQIAFFGGDHDNFEYPRYNLDAALFRVYENDAPLRPEHYLRWTRRELSEGELIFIAGHPGSTQRLLTVDHLRFLRDVQLPNSLASLWRSEVKLQIFSSRSDEHERVARDDAYGVANARKALGEQLENLQDPSVFARKLQEEQALINQIRESPEHPREWLEAWPAIARAKQVHRELLPLNTALTMQSKLYNIALDVVRVVAEREKPNTERLREYSEAALDSVFLELYSDAPLYEQREIAALESGLARMAELLGAEHELVIAALDGKSPRARAHALAKGTRLYDPPYRRQLVEGGIASVSGSDDAMIKLALRLDPAARAVRKRLEDEVQAVERDAYGKIAAARFAVQGESMPPDATFSLRLSYGTVKGYADDERSVPAFTSFGGLFELEKSRRGRPPFDLPQRWKERQSRLNPSTPFNFICTPDIIGGNSGSPVVDRAGELVGLIFDGNLHSLGWNVLFDDRRGRAVAVDARALIAALREVYDASELANELLGTK